MTDYRLPPMVAGPTYPEINPIDEAIAEALDLGVNPSELQFPEPDLENIIEPPETDIVKRLSSSFGRPDARRRRLIRRLKRRRSYAAPVRGGTKNRRRFK